SKQPSVLRDLRRNFPDLRQGRIEYVRIVIGRIYEVGGQGERGRVRNLVQMTCRQVFGDNATGKIPGAVAGKNILQAEPADICRKTRTGEIREDGAVPRAELGTPIDVNIPGSHRLFYGTRV